MPRPITESQFSNNSLVSGDGKPLTDTKRPTSRKEIIAYRQSEKTATNETTFEPPQVL